MLIRLLILIIIAAVVYRALKSWLGGDARIGGQDSRANGSQVDNVMIKDPVCGTYFVQRKGVSLSLDNQRIDFCSEACRDRYLARESKGDEASSP